MPENSKGPAPQDVQPVKLWDPALRVFHWALATCVCAAWYLGEYGPVIMTLHFYCGYVIIGLLGFRILWGLVGPAPARFSNFIYGPRTTLGYLQTLPSAKPSYWPGHNPIGALSVFALIAALIVQTTSGLFSDPDDFINAGPLADTVSSATRRTASQVHEATASVILILVGLHLCAIAYYRLRKGEDLVTPMITGWKRVKDRET